tara:strand:+ start:1564 stop:1944 length:381 start_codon:yes stop_codon:yes gene_type:complete
MIITGQAAIDYAKRDRVHLTLYKYADPIEEARAGLTVEEAEEVAREDASLVWISAPTIPEELYEDDQDLEDLADFMGLTVEEAEDCSWCGGRVDSAVKNRRGEVFCAKACRRASNRALKRFLGGKP